MNATMQNIEPSRHARWMAGQVAALLIADGQLGMTLDAADVTIAFAREFEHIDQELTRTEFAPLSSEQLIPYDPGGGPTAQAETYRMVTQVGRARFAAHTAGDIPTVNVKAKEKTQKTEMLTVGYEYDVMDLLRSAENPTVRLDTELKTGAVEAIARLHEETAALGNAEFGWPGFVNCEDVPLVTPLTGDWLQTTTTPDDILNDVLELFYSVKSATLGVIEADTMAIPLSYEKLFNRRLGDGSDTTIREWLLKNIPGLKSIVSWQFLDTADDAGTGPRVVVYRKSKDVLRYFANLMFREQPPQYKDLKIKIPCFGVAGGMSIRKPLGMAYMDTGVPLESS